MTSERRCEKQIDIWNVSGPRRCGALIVEDRPGHFVCESGHEQ